MIKTKFVFAVSLVAMLAVSSAWADDPADTSSTTDTVATEHTVYTDQSPTSGAGIAGVSYVNKAVNRAGASAQAAEAHAAAAGQSALNAASSAAAAASSAKSANDALANKQDKSTAVKVTTTGTAVGSATVPVYVNSSGVATAITSYSGNAASATKATQDGNGKVIADTYATKAQVDSLGNTQSGLVTSVNELTTGKQDKLTAGTNITIAEDGTISAKDTVYTLPTASATTLGGVKVDTALSSTSTNPVQNKVINTALAGKLSTSGTAAKATADASGNNIVNTYATKTALSEGLATKQATLTTSNIKGSGSVSVGISDGVITVSGTDNNTTYSTGTATTSGLTKLYTGTGTNTDGTMTQAALNTALAGKLSTSGTAAKATADASGNNIVNTYATKTALSEGLATKQATLTTSNIKGSGSVTVGISDGVITVSGTDNNTTYSTGTATTSGLTKLYTGTGMNTDGTMTQAALNTALAGKLSTSGNAASATKATQDGNGKVIADTYATKAQVNSLGDTQSELVTSVNELKTGKQDALGYTAENSANKVTSVSSTSTDTQYPSAKAMYTALSGKQATIGDLATIRSGAAAGATAVQDLGDLGVTATAAELNYVDGVTSNIQTQLNAKQASLGYTAENSANKVTSVSSTSTDTQYPSAKAMYTALSGKQASLGYTAENSANKVTSVSSTSTDTQYPSAKAMYTALSGKQATISDLATIRSGAAAGATAVQDLGDLGVTATAAELNYVDGVTSNIQTQLNAKQASLGYTAENSANKVTSVSSTSTDTQYPSAKAMYTALSGKQASLGYTAENSANKVTSVSSTSTDTQYPSAKAMYTALSGKQDKSTAVKVTTSGTAVGSATVPVYVNSSGVATAITSYSGNAASATKATQDGNGKVIADTYATKAQVNSLGDTQSELVTSVNELTTGKQDKLTATGSANRPVYAVAGGVAAVTGMSIPYGAESNPTSWATIWVE